MIVDDELPPVRPGDQLSVDGVENDRVALPQLRQGDRHLPQGRDLERAGDDRQVRRGRGIHDDEAMLEMFSNYAQRHRAREVDLSLN